MSSEVHFMSENQAWGTPRSFMAYLNDKFGWEPDLDAAATVRNTKAARFFNPQQDGLAQPWFGRVWLNPPFGRELPLWLEKCAQEIQREEVHEIYCLIPARTDTRWFHDIVMPNAYLLYLIKGRFNFVAPGTADGANAPFPSMLVVFRKHWASQRAGITTLEVPKEARGYD